MEYFADLLIQNGTVAMRFLRDLLTVRIKCNLKIETSPMTLGIGDK